MNRHPALAGLSREHHHALLVALTLRRVQEHEGSLAYARQTLRGFVEGGGARHFELEEQVLLPAFAAHGRADHPLVAQTLVEHVTLRRQIEDLLDPNHAPASAIVIGHALGTSLDAHVRLGERELFPLIEEAMPEAALQRLGTRLGQAPDDSHRG